MSAIGIVVDGRRVACTEGASVAAALLAAGITAFRTSVHGHARVPVCGMGICHECRVRIDGRAHVRACMVVVRDGMEVTTGDAQR